MTKVALLGLGTMGAGMAGRLLAAGFPLTVWNRSPARAESCAQNGATVAPSPRAAAQGAEIIISMLADDAASRTVWAGADGALAAAQPGAILIEASTLSPGWVNELAAAARARGCDLLDAPVTGSKAHAANGELLFLVGGASQTLERALPVLKVMSRDVIHLGPTGSGALLKLINNFLCGVQAASLAEALALIEKSDLNREQALAMLLNGAGGSPLIKTLTPRMTARDYNVNFVLDLMKKDLSYALAEAERYATPLNTAAAAQKLFEQAADAGFGQVDFAAVVEPLR